MTGVKSRRYTNTKMIGKKINQLATELAPVSTDLTIIGDPISGVSKKITLAQLGAIFSGAVSFYTDLASFPATGDINVIYCAKDTQKLYLWSGSAYTEVFPSQALLDTYQLRSEKGNANGYASLDSGGKVPISQLPSSIMEYKGTWNAATNTPTLANGTGDTGDVYICNVAGTVNFGAGPITFAVGDYVIYSGTIWQRSSGAVGTVTSVAVSRSGDALAITGSPVTTSGTINVGFAGNSTQYINGAGNLVTFPGVINEAQNLITEVYNKTGATLTKGTVVYINGGQGNLPTITKALATGDSTSAQTYGIVRNDITNNNNGYVVVAGRISDLDTQAYTEGTQLYLSATTAGAYTSTKQYAPNHLVYVGIVVRAHPTQGVIEVKIQNGYELDELHNVAAQTPTNNDGIFWEASTSLWKNKSIATILGYTPQAQLNGTGFVKASGTTITYDNSTYLTTSAASTTYLPMVLSSTANFVDINGQQFSIYGSAGGFTSGRIIVDPLFSALGYQNTGVFNGLKILTNGNAEFTNSGITRFFNQVRFDSTLTDGTYTYTLPGATGTIALVGGAGVGTVTSVGLSSATSGVTIGSTPITTSGTITLAIATASGSQQGLLSSTDWTTFNSKQNALTNPVTGTGTTNYLPKFTGASTIGNSILQEGTNAIGLGVTPSAWSLGTALEIANGAAILGFSNETFIANNAYFDGGWKYRATATAQAYFMNGGEHKWQIAPSGTAGNAISFTQAMTLNASGNLSIGNTNDTYKLDVSGSGRFSGLTQDAVQTVFRIEGKNASSQVKALDFKLTAGTPLWTISTAAVGTDAGINIMPNGSAGLSLAYSTGAATFSGNINVTVPNTPEVFLTHSNTSRTFLMAVDGSNAFFRANSTNNILFQVAGGTNVMALTSGGNVGIGTTAPSTNLHVQASVTSTIRIKGNSTTGLDLQNDVGGCYLVNRDATDMYFFTNSVQRMNIKSTGIINLSNVPSSSAGLSSGDIYKSAGVLMIV
jgi:hypothetical protein